MAHVIVVGGGPAGLMAAEVVSAAGVRVDVYDGMATLGRKFLMAGRGGLNLTHSEPAEKFLSRYGAAAPWLAPKIDVFPRDAVIGHVEGLGQPTFVGSSGRVFPRSMKASPLLRAWLERLARQGVVVHPRHRLVELDDDGRAVFATRGGAPIRVQADAIVLAMGGASWPRLGSDGAWVEILERRGVEVQRLVPSNVSVTMSWSEHFRSRFAGTPLKRIELSVGDVAVRGEAVVTETGLEGGAVYALSATLRAALSANGRARVIVDLKPDTGLDELVERLRRPRGKQSTASWLRKSAQLSPVAIALLRESRGAGAAIDALSVARSIKALPLNAVGLGTIDRAISSAGGIDLREVGPGMMLSRYPGVFVAGEMLDWEAPTGGYLLHGCYATGHAAGQGVLDYLGQQRASAPIADHVISGNSD
jgi:uncharacterized flavoprotein (TIGR03862 family)